MGKPLTVVEVDVPYCANTYGLSPCTAALGVTGDVKCFNTTRTCQDKPNFVRTHLTLRFCTPHSEMNFPGYPALEGVNATPCRIEPGKSMGTRASVRVSMNEFRSSDTGLDKYVTERAYDPFTVGTFWGKLRARIPSLEGCPLRVMRGQRGASLDTFTTEHYVVTSAASDASGVTIVAKDPLALCDGKKSQAPSASTGRLLAAIDEDDASATLTPTGIGDLEYGASGKLCLGGKEVVSFTRSGDTLTLTARHTDGTGPAEHDAGTVAQQCLVYSAQSPAEIIYDLLVTWTEGFDAAWADLPQWETESSTYIGSLFSRVIPAPTEVRTLLNEVIEEAGLAIWWDTTEQCVKFQSLRPVVPSATEFDDSLISANALECSEQPAERVSIALTYFAVDDVTNKNGKEENFRASEVDVDTTGALDYTLPAFRKTLSRWIAINNRSAAERLNTMILSRFRDGPRMVGLELHASVQPQPVLGTGVRVRSSVFQGPDGQPQTVPFFVVSADHGETSNSYVLEELHFVDVAPVSARSLFLDSDQFNVNLRDVYDTVYDNAPADLELTVYITAGAWIGSAVEGVPSLLVDDNWPVAATITIIIQAGSGIAGYGGDGGGPTLGEGTDGGTAFVVERAITVNNLGIIGGGGGGGGAAYEPDGGGLAHGGGGGGAGFRTLELVGGVLQRLGGYTGANYSIFDSPRGLLETGALGGRVAYSDGTAGGGDGGNLGMPGTTPGVSEFGTAFPGGAAGNAIEGVSFITFTAPGDIRGAQVG